MVDQGEEKREKARFERRLKDVGENLPDDAPGIEGADIGEIHRHEPNDKKRIQRALDEPHADARQEAVDEMHLAKDDE